MKLLSFRGSVPSKESGSFALTLQVGLSRRRSSSVINRIASVRLAFSTEGCHSVSAGSGGLSVGCSESRRAMSSTLVIRGLVGVSPVDIGVVDWSFGGIMVSGKRVWSL